MNNSSGSVEELKESHLIIYIIGIIGNSDVSCASTFETQAIGETGSATVQHLSSRSLQLAFEQYG